MFNRTYINIHPCAYDAYGMSIVEAAAFGHRRWSMRMYWSSGAVEEMAASLNWKGMVSTWA